MALHCCVSVCTSFLFILFFTQWQKETLFLSTVHFHTLYSIWDLVYGIFYTDLGARCSRPVLVSQSRFVICTTDWRLNVKEVGLNSHEPVRGQMSTGGEKERGGGGRKTMQRNSFIETTMDNKWKSILT